MSIKRIMYFTGRIMIVASALIMLPVFVALIYGETDLIMPFVIPAAASLAIGLWFVLFKPSGSYIASEGFAITAFSWILLSAIGCLPFVLSGEIPNYINAFFETVSGFTTTGSSIVAKSTVGAGVTDGLVQNLSKSILFWRSFTHWVGGMGVLAFGIALFPVLKGKHSESGSEAHILRAESPGPTYGKIVSKVRFNTRILYAIYLAMTVLEIVFLLFGGMPLFDSVVNSFATAGTGGFGIHADGIGLYGSVYIEMVISVFMILFGINFNVYYFMLIRKFRSAFKIEEVRWYLGIVGASVIAIALNTLSIYKNFATALRYSIFQVASIVTTTGFATADFNLWPSFSKVILVLLMFIGACAGSTGGGFKVSRVIILVKTAIREVKRSVKPRSIHAIRCDGEAVEHAVIMNVCAYFVVYMFLIAISTLIVSFDGESLTTSFTAVVSCTNNIGPGLDKVGPMENFALFSPLSKIVLSFDMLLGRLEIFPFLIAIAPAAWRNR